MRENNELEFNRSEMFICVIPNEFNYVITMLSFQ